MPLTVSFQLSDRDLKYFRDLMRDAKQDAGARDSAQIFEAARKLLNDMRTAEVPDFVRERMEKLDLLFQMVEDSEWRLEGQDRNRVVYAMAYLADPADAIPDQIPGLGFLDDAIMVELVCQDLRHEIEAYSDFCASRLPHLDEVVLDWVRGPDFDRLLVDTVRSTFPPHEHDHFIAHYRGLMDMWKRDEENRLSHAQP